MAHGRIQVLFYILTIMHEFRFYKLEKNIRNGILFFFSLCIVFTYSYLCNDFQQI